MEDIKWRLEEHGFIESEIANDPEMGRLPAAGGQAIRGLPCTLPAMADPSSTGQVAIENKDLPFVGDRAHLAGIFCKYAKVVEPVEHQGKIEVSCVEIVSRHRTDDSDLYDRRRRHRLCHKTLGSFSQYQISALIVHWIIPYSILRPGYEFGPLYYFNNPFSVG